ncbi:MAG: hypothetical protein ACXVFT_09090 [Solirubrobacteraceae bacterium]
MLHATLVLAADAAEKSKVPFYICGGALAAWAVILGLMGLARPAFPVGRAKRGVMGLSFVLMVAAMATAVITA